MSRSGWTHLPVVSPNSVVFLRKFNKRKAYLKAAILFGLLSSFLAVALLFCLLGG